jgi:hypothetical protein
MASKYRRRAGVQDIRQTLLVLLSVLGLAVAAPGAAVAKPDGTDRPVTGVASGTTTLSLATSPFSGTTEGTALISELGKTSYSSNFTFVITGTTTFNITGTETFVAASGDMLFTSFTGTGTSNGPFAPGQTSETTATYTVTGGTGRFDDASGTLTATVLQEIVSVVGANATATHTGTLEGTISY